jgi:hypothetical protein
MELINESPKAMKKICTDLKSSNELSCSSSRTQRHKNFSYITW